MARVPYVSREDLPAEKQSIYDNLEATRGGIDGKGIPNSFRLLLNSPDAAEAVGALGEHIQARFHASSCISRDGDTWRCPRARQPVCLGAP